MIVDDGLAADIVSDIFELGLLYQRQILLFDLETVVHIANEVHQLLVSVYQCVWNLVKDNVLGSCDFRYLHRRRPSFHIFVVN